MRPKQWFLQDEANGGDQGGGGGADPAQAREFLTSFAPNPDVLKDMPDDQVLAWHGNVTKQVSTAQQKALETHDWRKSIAGDNPDALKTLERFQSPKALYESYDQFRTKLSKGELRAVADFPAKGSDEEKATWRQQNGVPVDGKYELKLPEGVQMTDQDKPLVESFMKHAHEKNMPAGAFNEATNWFFQNRAEIVAKQKEEFEIAKRDTAAALGAEWGADYKTNLNKIQGLLDATIASDEDGVALKDSINRAIQTNPAFARHYAQIALEVNPSGAIVPGDRHASEQSVVDGIKQIESDMKKDRAAYNKDEAKRARYVELVGAYQKLTGREWGRA